MGRTPEQLSPEHKSNGKSMRLILTLKRVIGNSDRIAASLEAVIQGMDNQSRLVNEKANQLIAGMENQSCLNDKADQLIGGIENQSRLINDKADQLIGGMENQSRLINGKADQLIAGMDNQSQ